MKTITSGLLRNKVFSNLVLFLVMAAGVMASLLMVREDLPDLAMNRVMVSVSYPGADPAEVEEGISRQIEEAVEGLEGVKEYSTYSEENLSTAEIVIKEGFDENLMLEKIRARIGAISTFPPEAENPVITELVHRTAVMVLYLTGRMSETGLKEWAGEVKDELRSLPEVSQVEITGSRDYEIGVELSPEDLLRYNLTLSQVAEAIRNNNLNLAGGTIRAEGEEIRIITTGRQYSGRDLGSLVVMAGPEGEIVTLDRLARIDDGFIEDAVTAEIDGRPAVLLTIYKTSNQDSIDISEKVRTYVNQKQGMLPPGVRMEILNDNAQVLKVRLKVLIKNGIYGMLLVFLLLWLFLEPGLAFWAGMGIPVSIFGALFILFALGGTINMVSIFGFILVLGIIVDDSIVVGEAIHHHRQSGCSSLTAVTRALSEVGGPVFLAVLTTVLAFIPLLFGGGLMGKFISILPRVVIACLVISLLECLFLLPSHLTPGRGDDDPPHPGSGLARLAGLNRFTSRGLEWFIEKIYKPFLGRVLEYRYIVISASVFILLFTLGLGLSGVLKFEALPEMESTVLTALVEFPDGTPPEVTRETLIRVDRALTRLAEKATARTRKPLLKNRVMIQGQFPAGDVENPVIEPKPYLGAVQAFFFDPEERGVSTRDLIAAWEKEIGTIAGVRSLTVAAEVEGNSGPPVVIWIQGRDQERMMAAAVELKERLQKYSGVLQARTDYSPGKVELRLELKPEAHTMGFNLDDLARQIRAGHHGAEAVRLQRGRDDVRIKIRYAARQRRSLADLTALSLRTPDGGMTPLSSVAAISIAPGCASITRTNGLRRIAVEAFLDTRQANAGEIVDNLSREYFPEFGRRHPGLMISIRGEEHENEETFQALKIGFPLALLGIFLVLGSTFHSYWQPLVIISTIPAGAVGAFYAHLLLGVDLSLLSIFGLAAMAGVVLNDAIVLIDKFNHNLAAGLDFHQALIQAGARRFRAILLTSVSTAAGLVPLITEKNLEAQMLIPMALSLAGGVILSTGMTLVLLPGILLILNDFRLIGHRLVYGAWPGREEIEPGRGISSAPAAGTADPGL